MRDPITYIDKWKDSWEGPPESFGYTVPGFYFWDETWTYLYGPFHSRDMAKIELQRYAEYLDKENRN